ncbi:hypothetical protein [Burkholderia sp. Ac-20392]|uniref:hypothetical protein n=1 Tax=Burkholderia sp. Ac-20392 TaxID=2703905 RepID=UPI001981B47E|nr:hypothetical protein [Burkholderia sp. Ac-20392]MBN3797941.1 hypothetical protein [Burkholderia sp. Ac-20392]
MAIFVTTQTPKKLLSAIKQAISEEHVTTWSRHGEDHFTHSAEQWARRAWFKARIEEKRIVFNIVPPKGKIVSRATYGIYHGRFIEMLLNHFDEQFESASATAMPTDNDRIRSRTATSE